MLDAAINKRDKAHDARNEATKRLAKPTDPDEMDPEATQLLQNIARVLIPKNNLEASEIPLPTTPTHKDAAMRDLDGKNRNGQDTEETAQHRPDPDWLQKEFDELEEFDPEKIRQVEIEKQALWQQQAQQQQAILAQHQLQMQQQVALMEQQQKEQR